MTTALRTLLASAIPFMLVGAAAPAAIAQSQPPAAEPEADPEKMIDEALAHLEAGDQKAAARLVHQVSLIQPSLPKLFLARGLIYVATGRSVDAVGEFATYNKSPEGQRDYRGFAALGKIFQRSKMFREAVEPLSEAAKHAPLEEKGKNIRAQITMNLASCYASMKRTKKSLETAQAAQALAPNDADIQLRLAEIAAAANDYKLAHESVVAAVAIFQSRINDDAFDEDAHQKLRKAFEVFSALLQYNRKLEPKNGEHDLRYAQLMCEAAELDRRINLINARKLVQQALTKSPDDVRMHITLAEIEIELDAVADARVTIQKALEKHPDNEELKQKLAAIDSGQAVKK